MIDKTSLFAWIAIGAGAALAGMIWPFRRGVMGVVINLFVGAAGAVLTALVSYAVLPHAADPLTTARLLFAAIGAIAALGITHAAWLRQADRRRRAV
ncbi:MAG: hypothetical protein FWD17_16910 [Polyangiaceae bacterium]|nr:hypothetical protein [Polyangiaceae bacterium]